MLTLTRLMSRGNNAHINSIKAHPIPIKTCQTEENLGHMLIETGYTNTTASSCSECFI